MSSQPIQEAARILAEADALLVLAGPGMGVDSGLPDFRGDDGFWKGPQGTISNAGGALKTL